MKLHMMHLSLLLKGRAAAINSHLLWLLCLAVLGEAMDVDIAFGNHHL